MNRCRNCGSEGHPTQHCNQYGPWFPEPGKDRSDYASLEEDISRQVAVDIIHEHESDHETEGK